jgi:hypothetical protein
MIQVFDNFLTPSYADAIQHMVLNEISYIYAPQTSEYNEEVKYMIRTDQTLDIGQMVCPILYSESNKFTFGHKFEFIKPMFYILLDRSGMDFEGIVRLKANILLQNPLATTENYNIPHQDSDDIKCYSMIYYCNDSDGDTFLFNEFYDADKPPERLTIHQKVTPRKNRAVLFESRRYHASSNPIVSRDRFVLNFVLKLKE